MKKKKLFDQMNVLLRGVWAEVERRLKIMVID